MKYLFKRKSKMWNVICIYKNSANDVTELDFIIYKSMLFYNRLHEKLTHGSLKKYLHEKNILYYRIK